MKLIGLNYLGVKNKVARFKSGKTFETGEEVNIYVSPDFTEGSYEFFMREASKGRLHGLIAQSE